MKPFTHQIFLFFALLSASLYGQQESDTLTIMFAGDIMSHGPQLRAAYNAKTKTYDYNENFKYVKDIFKQADFVIANLETTIGVKPYSGYPQFSAPVALLTACKDAGITHFATANNHACDKRKKGIINTITVLDTLHLEHFGTYKSSMDKLQKSPLLIQKNGFSIALLNYTYGTNGLPIPKPTIVNLLDTIQIKNDIIEAKKLHPDGIIAFVHWGNQYKHKPNVHQKNMAKWLHKNGVAMVIGSHPHVIQPNVIKMDKSNALQQELTVYSLGNFISNQRTFPRAGSMIVEVKLVKNSIGELQIVSFKTYPIWVYKYTDKQKTHYEILPVELFKFNPVYFKKNYYFQQMHKYLKHYHKILHPDLNKNKGL